jgi:ankyrin repeat protein
MSGVDDFASAIQRGETSRVKSILDSGSIDVNVRLPRGLGHHDSSVSTPLMFAASLRHDKIVDLLLKAGAHVDIVDDAGRTACHAAVADGRRRDNSLALLLAHKPNLALKDHVGRTALDFSFQFGDNELVSQLLVEAGSPLEVVNRDQLFEFAITNTSTIQALLNRGLVLNDLRTNDGRTLLHFAAVERKCDTAVLDMLINVCGVDLEARDMRGATCTHYAAVFRGVDVLRRFIDAGAVVDGVDEQDRTPLHVVDEYVCTIALLAAGADVGARDSFGRTPAHHIGAGATWTVNALVAGGADLDATDRDGATAHHVLAARRLTVDPNGVEVARRDIALTRLDFVRHRALQVCVGLQSRGLDALQTCEILRHACGPVGRVVPFHQWWAIATIVKHFKSHA